MCSKDLLPGRIAEASVQGTDHIATVLPVSHTSWKMKTLLQLTRVPTIGIIRKHHLIILICKDKSRVVSNPNFAKIG